MQTALTWLFRPRWVRFAAIGGGSAICNLLLLHWWVNKLHWPYLWACLAAFVLLTFTSYALNKTLTFGLEREVVAGELVRFYVVNIFSLSLNLSLMYVLVSLLGLGVIGASVIVTLLLAVMNYVLHARLTFHRPAPQAGRPLRVFQISAFFANHGGGIEVVADQLARHMVGQGVVVHWMAGGPAEDFPISLPAQMTVERAASFDVLEARLGLPMPVWSLRSLAAMWSRLSACDVLHIHDFMYLPHLMAMVLARLRGCPIVLTQHVGDIPFTSKSARLVLTLLNRTLGRLVLGGVDQVVFVGQPVMDYFQSFVQFRRPPELVSNGVDHRRYNAVEHLPEASGPVRALFVGRFVEKKGLPLLRACMDVPGVSWTFVGWGPLSPRHWEDVALPPLQVLEGLRAEEVVPHYQSADVLVLPSRGEGFPLVVQEALACGTPVLVSAEVAEAFPVLDPQCVYQVELRVAEPAAALRDTLARLTADPHLLRSGRVRAHSLSRQWGWDRCAQAYLGLYQRVVPVVRSASI